MDYDLVVIGAGSGGLTAAEFAATLGLRVALVERHRVGGDCLWTGCVPSKALIAAARVAHTVRHAGDFGVHTSAPEVDLTAVWARIARVQGDIATTDDNPEHLRDLGIEVLFGHGRLAGPHEVVVDGTRRLTTRFVLVCTGSSPAAAGIDGEDSPGVVTSETLWSAPPPRSVVMVGGGPIAVELAQALVRLGVPTTVLQRGPRLLPREEPELVDRLSAVLRAEGVDVRLDATALSVTRSEEQCVVTYRSAGAMGEVRGAMVMVAAGRRPNVEGLGLEDVGVQVGAEGIEVDDRSRTSVPSVYAVGDVTGGERFTHVAGYHAALAVRDMFLPGPGRRPALVPWCTFTEPELGHVGLTLADATARHGTKVVAHRLPLSANDRARADGADGEIVVVTHRGRIVGAHILAPAAGELIHELALAMHHGMRLSGLASLIHAYPTVATSVGRLAGDAAFATAQRFAWLARRNR